METPVSESAHLNKHSGIVVFPLTGPEFRWWENIAIDINNPF